MIRFLGALWRIVASGVAFSTFGVIGVLVSVTVFPALYLFPFGVRCRRVFARGIIGFCFRLFTGLLCRLRLIHPQMEGLQPIPLDGGYVVIANHPTLTDVVYLLSRYSACACVVKLGVWNNICMRIPVRSAGYIPSRNTEQLLADCVACLNRGESVLVFPEGTRSFPDGLQPFTRGFSVIALRAERPIFPVLITCTPPTLSKGRRWYRMANRCCDLVLQSKKPFDTKRILAEHDNVRVAARVLTETVEQFYGDELERYYSGD